MLKVNFNKNITLFKESKVGTSIDLILYKDFSNAIEGVNELTVNYDYGSRKKRIGLLESLGFVLKQVVFYNDEDRSSKIQEVWSR